MDQRRLLLLGLLRVQEQHGYQILDFVERNLSRISDLKKATAYYELKRMEKDQLVSVRQEQEGSRPPRRVYSLTPAGEQLFRELLRESLQAADVPTCGSDIGLMFMDSLPPAEVRELLADKVRGLRERLTVYRGAPSHGPGSAVDLAIGHVAARLEAEIALYQGLIDRLEGRSAGPAPSGHRHGIAGAGPRGS